MRVNRILFQKNERKLFTFDLIGSILTSNKEEKGSNDNVHFTISHFIYTTSSYINP